MQSGILLLSLLAFTSLPLMEKKKPASTASWLRTGLSFSLCGVRTLVLAHISEGFLDTKMETDALHSGILRALCSAQDLYRASSTQAHIFFLI